MTPADLFDRAGKALYGDQYVAPLAALLDVDKNTVGKWRDGKSRIPVGVWSRLGHELLKRGELIAAVQHEVATSGLSSLDAARAQRP